MLPHTEQCEVMSVTSWRAIKGSIGSGGTAAVIEIVKIEQVSDPSVGETIPDQIARCAFCTWSLLLREAYATPAKSGRKVSSSK